MPEYSEPNENTVARLALLLSHTILKNRNQHMAAIGLTASQADCLRFCVEEGGGTVIISVFGQCPLNMLISAKSSGSFAISSTTFFANPI